MGVFADLGGDGGAKLRRGSDVVEVVNFHDGRNGSASGFEELEGSSPSFC